MANWTDVRRIARALPEATELRSRDGLSQWRVSGKLFAWERPLRRADMQALGDRTRRGPILAAHVPHLGAKEAVLATNPRVYFTTPHFDGYPTVLARLGRISMTGLEELLIEAWADRAPKRVAKAYLNRRFGPRR